MIIAEVQKEHFEALVEEAVERAVRRAVFPRYFDFGGKLHVQRDDGAVFVFYARPVRTLDGAVADGWVRVDLPPVPEEK